MDLSRNCVSKRRKGFIFAAKVARLGSSFHASRPPPLSAVSSFKLKMRWIGWCTTCTFLSKNFRTARQCACCGDYRYYWHIINCPWCLYIHGQLLIFGYLEIIFMIEVFTRLFPARALFPSFRHVPDRNIRSKVRTDWRGYKYHRREGTNTSSDEARQKTWYEQWTWHDIENFPHLLCEHDSPFTEKSKSGEMFWSFLS